jgi:hypothetical protein
MLLASKHVGKQNSVKWKAVDQSNTLHHKSSRVCMELNYNIYVKASSLQ